MDIKKFDKDADETSEHYIPEDSQEVFDEYCDLYHLGKLSKFKNLGIMNLERFNKYLSDGWNPCMLMALSPNGWMGLNRFDILKKEDLEELIASIQYECPFTTLDEKRTYYGAIPIVILSKNKISEIPGSATEWERGFSSDVSFWKPERFLEIEPVTKALNGHGFCDFITPYDGSGSWILITLQINDDTLIVFRTWDWYNK